MNPIINPFVRNMCFRNISEETFLNILRSSDVRNITRGRCKNVDNLNAVEHFLRVRSRFIVYDAIGEEDVRDIKMMRLLPADEEYIELLIKNNSSHFVSSQMTKMEPCSNHSNLNIIECIKEYLNCKYRTCSVKCDSVKVFSHLIYFLLKLEYENDIDLKPLVMGTVFMEQFVKYLRLHGLSTNTIISILNALKRILRWVTICGGVYLNDFESFKLRRVNNRPAITLAPAEIHKIYNFNPNTIEFASTKLKETYLRVRDHFVLAYYLGQRYHDMEIINKQNFGNSYDFFMINQQKNDRIGIVDFNQMYGGCPEIVKEILNRYSHHAPWNGALSTFNYRLHELCKYAGLNKRYLYEVNCRTQVYMRHFDEHDLITFYCARRSFETNALKRGVPLQVIKRALGRTK